MTHAAILALNPAERRSLLQLWLESPERHRQQLTDPDTIKALLDGHPSNPTRLALLNHWVSHKAPSAELLWLTIQTLSLHERRQWLRDLVTQNLYEAFLKSLTGPSSEDLGRFLIDALDPDPSPTHNLGLRIVAAPMIIVPGHTPRHRQAPEQLSQVSQWRCRKTLEVFNKLPHPVTILCSGGPCDPTRPNRIEALELKQQLLGLGIPKEAIAVEMRARHTTTNLRNAGRFMLRANLDHALIVTTPEQSAYLSFPGLSGFHKRCRQSLGYEVGQLSRRDFFTTHFKPSKHVTEVNPRDPLDP